MQVSHADPHVALAAKLFSIKRYRISGGRPAPNGWDGGF